jgi:hypothetical protein
MSASAKFIGDLKGELTCTDGSASRGLDDKEEASDDDTK